MSQELQSKILAKLSEAVYEDKPGHMINDIAGSGVSAVLDKKTGDNASYTILGGGPELSGRRVVVTKGTASLKDALVDAAMVVPGLAEKTNRYKNAEKFLQEELGKSVANPVRPGDVLLTGHSLGGGISAHLSRKYGKETEVFNPAINFSDLKNANTQVKSHIVKGDPVSYLLSKLKRGEKHYYEGSGSLLDRHYISNFTK